MRLRITLFSLAALACAPLFSQDPVVGVADPESLFTDKDPKLHANKQAALHIVKDLLEAGQWSEAPKYLTEKYIQHNPNFATGRETIMKAFGARPGRPIPAKMQTQIVSVVASGDYVVVSLPRSYQDPRDPSKCYSTTWFDMWRFVDGKADEHWDSANIMPNTQPCGAQAKGKAK